MNTPGNTVELREGTIISSGRFVIPFMSGSNLKLRDNHIAASGHLLDFVAPPNLKLKASDKVSFVPLVSHINGQQHVINVIKEILI